MRDQDGDERAVAAFGVAPLDDGSTYPGVLPRSSYLFTGDAIELVAEVGAGGLPDRSASVDAALDRLEARLGEIGATPLGARHAVLAYGSNRSPAQLRAKFAGRGVESTVPVLLARVSGLSVVHAAGVTRYGAVPATLVDDPGAVTEVAVTLLDDAQLAVVDATEPRHDRSLLDGDDHRLAFAADDGSVARVADLAATCRCYWSRRPVLTRAGSPVRLAAIASTGSVLPERTQAEVVDELLDVWAHRGRRFASGPVFRAAVRADPTVRAWVVAAAERLVDEPVGDLGALPPRLRHRP